jgi:hypothetical protein
MLVSTLLCPSPDLFSFNTYFAALPQRLRMSPDVVQTMIIVQCYLSDSVVRLFEHLHGAPYLVVVLMSSLLSHLRCRCVKYLASAKLQLPLGTASRYVDAAAVSAAS